MTDVKCDIGLFGVGVMGKSFAFNLAEKGFRVALHNRKSNRLSLAYDIAPEQLKANLNPCEKIEDFISSLKLPRIVILFIPAGSATESAVSTLLPLLSTKDIILDCANEWYTHAEARAATAAKSGIRYLSVGVSGGEDGARHGPAMMAGGAEEGYNVVSTILSAVAAQSPSGAPCVALHGAGGAGVFVKMIHNGIEYGVMQVLAEATTLLGEKGAEVFREWSLPGSDLDSYLVGVTADILAQGKELLPVVVDSSGSKGTGMWTVQDAAERGVAVPSIAAALNERYMSNYSQSRAELSERFGCREPPLVSFDADDVRAAVYASIVCCFAQGFDVLSTWDKEGKVLKLDEVARVWEAGCILRSVMLNDIENAFRGDFRPKNLLLDEKFSKDIHQRLASWRRVVTGAVSAAIPVPVLSSSLQYFDSMTSHKLQTASIIQLQRDYFGAHTYMRTDQEGSFHTQWTKKYAR